MTTLAVSLVLILCGFAAKRGGLLGGGFDRWATRILIHVLFPALSFASTARHIGPEDLTSLARLPALGACGVLLSLVTALLVLPFQGLRRRERGTVLNMGTFSNYGYIPIPIVGALMGERHVAYLIVHNVAITFLYWSLGAALMGLGREDGSGRGPRKGGPRAVAGEALAGLRRAVNVPVVALALGVLVGYHRAYGRIPAAVAWSVERVGDLTVPFAMVLTGSLLGGQRYGRALWGARVTYILPLQRLVLAPALGALALALVDVPPEERAIALLVLCMPSPASTPFVARYFGGDPLLAAWGPMVTTLAAVATVPLWMLAILRAG